MTPEQINYVQAQLKNGFTAEQVTNTLLQNGYSQEQATQLLTVATAPQTTPAQPISTAQAGAQQPQNQTTADQTAAQPTTTPQAPYTATAPAPQKSSNLKVILIIAASVVGGILIIGSILAATVLASLNDARNKGQDASVKQSLSGLRAEAEIHVNVNGGSYSSFCLSPALGRAPNADCSDSATAYRVSAPLNDGTFYCIDSTGVAIDSPTEPTGLSCK